MSKHRQSFILKRQFSPSWPRKMLSFICSKFPLRLPPTPRPLTHPRDTKPSAIGALKFSLLMSYIFYRPIKCEMSEPETASHRPYTFSRPLILYPLNNKVTFIPFLSEKTSLFMANTFFMPRKSTKYLLL